MKMLSAAKNIAGNIKMEIVIWLRFIYPTKIFNLNGVPVLFNASSRREMLRGWQYASPLKEPGTYEWLDSFVGNKDILYDIGCNTGGYAMYSAIKHKNINVFCIDPDVQNIGAVNKNIFLNKLVGRVLAFCVAVSNKNKLDQLNIFSEEAVLEPGYSGNSVATGNRSGSHQAIMKTGVISLTLDSMVYDYDFPCPNHIKIDVDGHEDKILSGSERVLKNKTLKTVLIECEYSNSALIDKFIEHGFERYEDFKSPLYKEYLINHNKDDMGNIVFIRKQ